MRPSARSTFTEHLPRARCCSTHKGRGRERRATSRPLGAYVLAGKTDAHVDSEPGGKRSRVRLGESGAGRGLPCMSRLGLSEKVPFGQRYKGCEGQICAECVFQAEGRHSLRSAHAFCLREQGGCREAARLQWDEGKKATNSFST